jgi:hypothetical protein
MGLQMGMGGRTSILRKALQPAIARTSGIVFVSKAYIPLHDYEETSSRGSSLCL